MKKYLFIFFLVTTYLFAIGEKEVSVPVVPADIIDFSTWKLQLPVSNESGTMVKEVYSDELLNGYQDEFFFLDPESRAVVFKAPVGGFTTPNSSYARSELRELVDGKNSTVNWGFYGTHVMSVTESVSETPSSGRVIVAQIHSIYPNGDNGPATVKVEYNGINKALIVKVKVSTAKDAGEEKFYFEGIEIGEKFDIELKIIDGIFYTTIRSKEKVKSFSYDVVSKDSNWLNFLNYFKVGCYTQDSHIDYENEYGEVKVYDVKTYHSDKVVEVKAKKLTVEPSVLNLGKGDTAILTPVFEPIETTDKRVVYDIIKGKDVVVINRDGVITAMKEGEAIVRVVSKNNESVYSDAVVKVSSTNTTKVSLIYNQDFSRISQDDPDLKFSSIGTASVSIDKGFLKISDSDPNGKGIFAVYFTPQKDTTTISLKIRLDRVDVKSAGTSKAQGSYLYLVMGGKEDGFLEPSDEMFRLRNKSTYRAGQLSEHRWVLTSSYLTPDINPDAANFELGEWIDITVITTPNNGTGAANTTDVYINGIKISEKMGNNKKSDFINQVCIYSGTKDLIDFSVDEIKVYSGRRIPDVGSKTKIPEKIELGKLPGFIKVGSSVSVDAFPYPLGSYELLSFSSLAKDVAVVSNDGLITAVKPGKGIVRVASKIESDVYKDYVFTVVSEEEMIDVRDIELSDDSFSILAGEKLQIGVKIIPANATEKSVSFKVLEGKEYVRVDSSGTVTAVKPGRALIRVTSLNDDSVFKDCTIRVVSDVKAGTVIYSNDFEAAHLGKEWITSVDKDTDCDIISGALHLRDNNVGGQPKAYVTFEPQVDTFTIQFKLKIVADPVYDDKKVSAVTVGIGSGKITSYSNHAFRFKTSASVENSVQSDRRFIYSRGESGYDRIPGNYELNKWYVISLTITPDNGTTNSNTADIYIDGEKVASEVPNVKNMLSIDKLIFQTGTKDLTEYYIDDLRIWTGDYPGFASDAR